MSAGAFTGSLATVAAAQASAPPAPAAAGSGGSSPSPGMPRRSSLVFSDPRAVITASGHCAPSRQDQQPTTPARAPSTQYHTIPRDLARIGAPRARLASPTDRRWVELQCAYRSAARHVAVRAEAVAPPPSARGRITPPGSPTCRRRAEHRPSGRGVPRGPPTTAVAQASRPARRSPAPGTATLCTLRRAASEGRLGAARGGDGQVGARQDGDVTPRCDHRAARGRARPGSRRRRRALSLQRASASGPARARCASPGAR